VKCVFVTSGELDALEVVEVPWFRHVVDCVASRYMPRWGWDYRLWSAILDWTWQRNQTLVRVPVGHACCVAKRLWPSSGSNCQHAP
jgi:hypothetical protein